MASLKEIGWRINTQTIEVKRADSFCGRLFWVTVSIACFVIFMYQACVGLKLYLNRPLSSNMDNHYHKQLALPGISICAHDAVTYSFMRQFNVTRWDDLYYIGTTRAFFPPFLEGFSEFFPEPNLIEAGQRFKNIVTVNNITNLHDYMLYDVGLEVDDVMTHCSLRGSAFPCTKMFKNRTFRDSDYCFDGFSHTNLQTVSGSRGAIRFILVADKIYRNEFTSDSWTIWLYPPSDSQESAGTTTPQTILFGSAVDLRVTKWKFIRLNTDRSPCSKGQGASFVHCQRECESRESLDTCGCVRIGSYKEPAWRFCEPGNESLCSYNVSGKVQCKCSVAACDSVQYKTEIIIRKVMARENETVVRLYYDTLSEIVMKQSLTLTPWDMIGSFGGQASLWLGVKFATVAQLVYYGWKALFNGRNRTSHQHVDPSMA